MRNTICKMALLTMLSACASEPVVLPPRPAPASAEDAACLRQCDGNYATCTSSGSTSGRTPIASTSGGILIGAMADSNARSKTQKTCAEFLKYCYRDCEQFE